MMLDLTYTLSLKNHSSVLIPFTSFLLATSRPVHFQHPGNAMMQMLRAWLVLALPCAAALNLLPQLRAAQPVLSRSSPLTMEAADDMASLQQQIERLQLQAKIKELQAQVSDFKPAAAPEPVPEVVVAPPPAVVAKVAEVVKAPEVVAPVAVPEVAAASPAEMADRIADAVKDAMPSFSMPSAAPDFAAAVPAADAATHRSPSPSPWAFWPLRLSPCARGWSSSWAARTARVARRRPS